MLWHILRLTYRGQHQTGVKSGVYDYLVVVAELQSVECPLLICLSPTHCLTLTLPQLTLEKTCLKMV